MSTCDKVIFYMLNMYVNIRNNYVKMRQIMSTYMYELYHRIPTKGNMTLLT